MKLLVLGIAIISVTEGLGQTSETKGLVELNSPVSYKMMDPMENLKKVKILLEEKQKGEIREGCLLIGLSVISIFDLQQSNTNSKFGYLMRHPTANNQIGKTVSEAVIHSAQMAFTGNVNNWLGAYAEILYNPEQSFGLGTITALARNQLQLRKGIIVLGDLDKFPIYFSLGKMDAPFGQMGTVSPFTNTTMWHAFGGLGYGAMVGFEKYGISLRAMAIQGGAQFRALHTSVDSSDVPSKLNNFSADLSYKIKLSDVNSFTVGGSYVLGTAYCQDFPITHFSPCTGENPAFSYYGTLNLKDRFTLKGGFAKTLDVWEGTHNPNPPLDVFVASKVSSLDVGGKYRFNMDGKVVYAISGEFSNFVAGPEGSPWERQNQYVLGFQGMIKKSSKLFMEVFATEGYAPLNFISGGNFTNLGITHSDANATSIGFVIGGQICF